MALSVNGELVDDSVIRQEAAMLRPRHEELIQGMDPIEREIQIREWSRENVIERVLLRQEALKDTTPVDPGEIESALEQLSPVSSAETAGVSGCATPSASDDLRREAEIRLRIDRLMAQVTGKVSRPKYKEIGDYYKKNREQFLTEETLNAAHIVKNVDENTSEEAALAAMKEVEAELASGADFHELADRLSDCAGNGGRLGWFPRGQMVEEFDEVVFSLKPGETSPVFRTVFGFHIAKVLDIRPAGYLGLQEVRDRIEEAIFRQKQESAVEAFVDKLRAKAEIKEVKQAQL